MSDQHFSFAKSIATVSLSGTLPEKLEAAAAVGFDGVEIFENDLLTYDGSPADIRRIAEGLGLEITIFQPFRDFEAMPENIRVRNLDRAERKFDIMQQLGTDLVLVCSNVQPSAIDDDAGPPPIWPKWRSAPPGAAFASATRRWPGAGTSTPGNTPGTSSSGPTIRPSA